MGQRLRGWLSLPPHERAALLRLLFGLPLMSLSLRVLDYRRTRRLVEWLTSGHEPRLASREELQQADRLAQLAATAGRHGLIEATCLRQSLLVYAILRRRGLQPELRLGVRRDGEGFAAHAWVELGGQRLAQSDIVFAPFAELPPERP